MTLAMAVHLCFGAFAYGQTPTPGNVLGPCLWLRVDTLDATVHYRLWRRYTGVDEAIGNAAVLPTCTINFHGVPDLPVAEEARWLIADSLSPEGSSMFMVTKPIDLDERVLWAMEVADTGRVVLTSHRAADLYTDMHLLLDHPGNVNARLTGHVHRADTSFSGEAYLRVGTASPIPSLPISGFEGALPEVLYFNRVLGPRERSRLSSYLAIKYGLSLVEEDYVSSKDRTVWANRKNRAYSHHVFGIAKDSASMLDQRQGTSAMEEGLLVIGVDTITTWHADNPALIPNDHYLITGDDGKARTWKPREPGQPQVTARTWHMQRNGSALLNTRLRLDLTMLLNTPEKADNFWLLIDRSGTGSFGPGTTDCFQALPGADAGTVDVKCVFWDVDGTGSDRYRFAAGGSFIPLTWLGAPNCDPPTPGSLTIQVPGGEAPIIARLDGVDHEVSLLFNVAADTTTTIALDAGEYDLTLSDNSGYTITDRIWIQPKDAPQLSLAPAYELTATEPLVLDATVIGAFTTYVWTYAGEVISVSARLVIEKPGVYTCTAVADGCLTRALTQVFTSIPVNGIELGVLPNPSLGGDFTVQVLLSEKVDATLTIANLQGTLVRQRQLRGQDFHRVQEHIPDAGEYVISVRTSDGQRSTRVIVL